MVQIHNEAVPNSYARVAGAFLFLAGLAALWALGTEWNPTTRTASSAGWFVLLVVGSFLAMLAVALGVRLFLFPKREPIELPRFVLAVGVILLLAVGLGDIALTLIEPGPYWSLPRGIVLGFGGALGAFQLLRRRQRGEPDRT